MNYSEHNFFIQSVPQNVQEIGLRSGSPAEPQRDMKTHIVKSADRARLAKTFYDARRAREQFFATTLFADPAWAYC